jgi:hypothetical protein
MVFWIICHRKAKKGHAIEELMIIKLFGSNYARDLLCKMIYYIRHFMAIYVVMDIIEFNPS